MEAQKGTKGIEINPGQKATISNYKSLEMAWLAMVALEAFNNNNHDLYHYLLGPDDVEKRLETAEIYRADQVELAREEIHGKDLTIPFEVDKSHDSKDDIREADIEPSLLIDIEKRRLING